MIKKPKAAYNSVHSIQKLSNVLSVMYLSVLYGGDYCP